MKKTLIFKGKYFYLCMILCLLPAGLSLAQISTLSNAETITITANGYGVDYEKAVEDALRTAVTNALGAYVSSETLVKNHRLILDEIVQYSGGFVKKFNVVANEYVNGLIEVAIIADVNKLSVMNKMKSLNIYTGSVDGQSLFSEAFTKIDAKRNAREVLASVIDKFPQAAYVIKTSRPEIISTDYERTTAIIGVNVKVSFDTAWLNELFGKLEQIALSTSTFTELMEKDYRYGSVKREHFAITTPELLSRSFCTRQYHIDESAGALLEKLLQNIGIELVFLSNEYPVATKKLAFVPTGKKYMTAQNYMKLKGVENWTGITDGAGARYIESPFFGGFGPHICTYVLPDYSMEMHFEITLTLEQMKRIKTIEARAFLLED